jgi:phosphatidylglycerophosphate synthase
MGRSPRAAVPNTRVISTAAHGLLLVLLTAWALKTPLQLDVLHVPRAAALFVAIMLLAIRYLPDFHPFPRFGPANQITTVRAAFTSLVASFIGEPATPQVATAAVVLACAATALDGFDGWIARRSGMSSAFGARFDMEVDALLILALSVLAWHHGEAGAWVLLSGLIRYGFLAAGWTWSWMQRALPPSRRRQAVCVMQVSALIVVMLPTVAPPASSWIAAAALSALIYSFAVDIRWLWQS